MRVSVLPPLGPPYTYLDLVCQPAIMLSTGLSLHRLRQRRTIRFSVPYIPSISCLDYSPEQKVEGRYENLATNGQKYRKLLTKYT